LRGGQGPAKRAEAEHDGWHAAGNEEKYLAASSMVEALRRQLQRLEAAAPPANRAR